MQETDAIRERKQEDVDGLRVTTSMWMRPDGVHRRSILVCLLLSVIVLLVFVPPLLNVGRFKRRIVASIGDSIARPVHLDKVSLVLLPFPGFRLENFVVEDDPAFGSEPVIRANTVVATLRFSSLWRRKVEFAKISLQEPSINLVRMPAVDGSAGRWNVESILLRAARMPAAPTAQATAGPEPRFPYIEATGARINIKVGDEKLPFSFTEADVALWLPRPMQWRVRLEGRPTRTDLSPSDTGTISLEGTVGRAERFDLMPIDLSGEWKNVPFGEASRVVMGRDAGLRGDLRLNASVHGTVGSSVVKMTLDLSGARRAEFVPPQALDLRAECQASATDIFHAFHEIRCSWPPSAAPSILAMTAELADIHHPDATSCEIGTPGLPAATLLQWLRIASPRVSPDIVATGTVTGSVTRNAMSGGVGNGDAAWTGRLASEGIRLDGGEIGDIAIAIGDIVVSSDTAEDVAPPPSRKERVRSGQTPQIRRNEFVMLPTTLTLGGREPAMLEGRFDGDGYTLHLTGNVLPSRLLAFAHAVPQFGDGLAGALPPAQSPAMQAKEVPMHLDLTSKRLWGGGQSWSRTSTKAFAANAEELR